MRRSKCLVWSLLCFVLIKCSYLGAAAQVEKEEAPMTVPTLSPPERNTTFLDGVTWCVAHSAVSQIDLQSALDWACGLGMADCKAIQRGGPCFEPNNLVSHASFAFNSFYQQNGNSDIACNFGGTAVLTKNDPSYEKCIYSSPGGVHSRATSQLISSIWRFAWILLLLYLGR